MESQARTFEVADGLRSSEPDKLGASQPLLQLLRYLKPHRRYVLWTVLFGSTGFLLSFVYPWIIGNVIDLIVSPARSLHAQVLREQKLLWFVQLAALTGVLHGAVVYGRGHFHVLLGDSIVSDLRRELFEHLQKLSVRFYAKQRTGTILSRVLYDVRDATSIIYMGVVVAAMDAAQLLIAFILLSQISIKLTLACFLVFPLYGVVFGLSNEQTRAASARVRSKMGQISGDMAERLAGQAVIKTFTAEKREAARFSAEVGEYHQLVAAESHQSHRVAGIGEFLVEMGTAIVIGYGGYLALQGELSAGMLTRFLGYVVILYGPVRRFAELNLTYQSSLSAIRRIFRLLATQPSVVDSPLARQLPPSHGQVTFEEVRFSYANSTDEGRALEHEGEHEAHPQWVIDGVDLSVQPGERIALVGTSGAGKTTLLSLLPRLYDVTHGRVLIDGVDVRDYTLEALRSAISIVQQDPFVFTGSIRDNIAYGKPHATMEEIVRAAQAAHAHEFIERIPAGYDAELGERGVNLSGGQRQRVSIARALLRDPKILILDEATSSLDAESEAIVQGALEELMRGRTCFIIAHRLSTIRNADRILVLENGRIAESGSHEQLMAHTGRYAQFIEKQAAV